MPDKTIDGVHSVFCEPADDQAGEIWQCSFYGDPEGGKESLAIAELVDRIEVPATAAADTAATQNMGFQATEMSGATCTRTTVEIGRAGHEFHWTCE